MVESGYLRQSPLNKYKYDQVDRQQKREEKQKIIRNMGQTRTEERSNRTYCNVWNSGFHKTE